MSADQAETVTIVEVSGPRPHAVAMLWDDDTISCECWCGWKASITDPDARDCVGQRRQFRAAEQMVAGHQYPDLHPAQAADRMADELWGRLMDWPVDVR